MSDPTRFPLAYLLVAACGLAACDRDPGKASDPPRAAPTSVDAGDTASPRISGPAAAGPAGQLPVDPVERRFSGSALDVVRQRSQPAQQWIVDEVHKQALANAEPEDCQRASKPEATRLIDLDDDGSPEVLSFYSLSGCTGGSVIQILSVLRRDDAGAWAPVLETALTVRPGEQRAVLDIGHGTITLAGTDDGFGGITEPEVIAIPATTALADGTGATEEGAAP